ncbi:uncharacterized protein Dwil_GK13575 [Drosophila willistoni]|uniref:Uncharacterized protein n=1 Tax=Drosophila willistoni TaxID=7260 RepID=B4NHY5_DROWI|nr:titin [Drosophila willistoni]EDW83635.1 uncharacterized protein Dwil_GK13575 [Drosophila willistoni]
MRSRHQAAWLIPLTLCQLIVAQTTEVPSALLPIEARNADFSGEEDVISTSYVLPNQIFNEGKPYYARQDPVSGQLDFSAKKPAGIEPEINEVLDPNEKIVISGAPSPNIHDFLNLPVKYSSSKFVYPLVSSSYANLKYQGSNKNYMTNKKPTSVVAQVTLPPPNNYHSSNYFTVPTTRLTAVTPTEAVYNPSSTSTTTTTTTKTTATTKVTSKRPSPSPKTTIASTRYTSTSRRPVGLTGPTTPIPPRTSTTRKKFVPTKKYSPAITSVKTTPTTTIASQPKPTASSSDVAFTTHHATPQAPIFPTDPTTTTKMYSTTTTSPPVAFTDDITKPPAVSSIPGSGVPNLDPADVYHTLGQKNNQAQQEQQQHQQQQREKEQQQQQLLQEQSPSKAPPMTLSDIFNSLAEEESAVATNYQQNQGFDAQGNLIEPIAPSRPSPFAMQNQLQANPAKPNLLSPRPQGPQETKVISGSQENYSNEYVSYQVQQPNVMQYRPVPGQINNVVISPEQQSATFVLGSQVQQVGVGQPVVGQYGPGAKQPSFVKENVGPVQYGQVINEDIANINIKHPLPVVQDQVKMPTSYQQMPNIQHNSNFHQNGVTSGTYQETPPEAPSPYQQLPLIGSSKAPVKPATSAKPMTTVQPTANQVQDVKELLVSTNIRFPANEGDSVEFSPASPAPGPPAGIHINGHAQPLSLQQIQNANPVVFPKVKDDDGVQIQQHPVVNLHKPQQEQQLPLTFPALQPGQPQPQGELPSRDMEPPPRYPTTTMPVQRPPPFYNEYNRKPQAGGPGPRPHINLPNILPQFRPNAKLSSGHPPNLKQEPGNIRLTSQVVKRPYNPSMPPQFAHRHYAMQGHQQQQQHPQQIIQKRYPMNRISEYPAGPPSPGDVNRRIYRPASPYGGHNFPYMPEHLYARRPNGPPPNAPLRSGEGYPTERHVASPIEPYKTIQEEGLDNIEEEDLVINDPPQPVTPSNDQMIGDNIKLEPVVTLQMLQSQKNAVSLPGDDTGDGEIQVTADNDPQEAEVSKLTQQKLDQSGLYVVFPMKATDEKQASEPPSAPAEYQNTPFSVIRDQPQEPILKNKKPQSLQQQTKVQPMAKEKFPYPIEKPDPSYTELNGANTVPGVLIAPRIISGAYGSGTEAPIAIAYTPTEPSAYVRTEQQNQKFSTVINEIRTQDTQTEEGLSGDFDLRGQSFEKNFMAPFYPSLSLGTATGPAGGVTNPNWNVVPSTTNKAIYEKNNINRADVDAIEENKKDADSSELILEKSELDNFQPQLQGGFKPIYPPGYKHAEQESDQDHNEEMQNQKLAMENKPLALSLVSQSPTTTTTTTTTSTSTTKKPPTTASSNGINSSSTSTTTISTTKAAAIEQSSSSSSTSTTSITKVPAQRKKSNFETSLAALLFGDDEEEFEEGSARKSVEVTKAQALPQPQPQVQTGPRNVPRMGPRSLSLS